MKNYNEEKSHYKQNRSFNNQFNDLKNTSLTFFYKQKKLLLEIRSSFVKYSKRIVYKTRTWPLYQQSKRVGIEQIGSFGHNWAL